MFEKLFGFKKRKNEENKIYVDMSEIPSQVPEYLKELPVWKDISIAIKVMLENCRIDEIPVDMPFFKQRIREIIKKHMWDKRSRNIPFKDFRHLELYAEIYLAEYQRQLDNLDQEIIDRYRGKKGKIGK